MKYLIGVISVVVLIVLVIAVIVSRPSDKNTQPVQTDGKKIAEVSDYASQNATVLFTQQGKLVGETERRSVRISVTATERRVEILSGYNENVEKSQTYPNTQAGYETFMKALDNAGFARERKYDPSDERGICPLGNVYIYQIKLSGSDKTRLWSTSCSAKQGTLAGSSSNIRRLFQAQVPSYNQFVSGVAL